MPKYLVQASYTADGLQGLHRDKASGRRRAVKKALASLGGKLEAMYYCFGEDDVILIADMPDNVSVAAISLGASSTGLVRTRTTSLLTVDEVDQALEKSVNYQPPGGKG